MKLEFKEPYPIYRGFFVPIWEERPIRVRRVTQKDIELFKKTLKKLKNLLNSLKRKDPKTIADAIAIFLKAPLIQEISPTVPSPLKAHALMLLIPDLLRELNEKKLIEDVYEFAEILAKLKPENLQLVRVLFEQETAESVEKLWLYFPADTRPGYNTSSLIAHLLLTSAIAWALEEENDTDESTINIIRIASLLHDIGKVVNPEDHPKASRKIAEYLLESALDQEVMNKVCELIEKHHQLNGSIRRADKLASAADRIDRIVSDLIGKDIEEIEKITGKSSRKWSCWKEAYKIKGDFLKDLTEKFVKHAHDLHLKKYWKEKEIERKVKVVLIDVGEIQNFIYRNQEIRSIVMASHIVDLVVHAHFLCYLNSRGLSIPPEAVIYSGGGNILLIVPNKFVDKVKRYIKDYEKNTKLRLYLSETEFSTNYAKLSKKLGEKILMSKYEAKLTDNVDDIKHEDLEDLCQLCYSSSAKETIETAEGIKRVCKTCKKLYDSGSSVHFSKRWEAEIKIFGNKFSPKDVFKKDWEDVKLYIMEIIAGHDAEELERIGRDVKLRDLAVIKFDGNMMGAFISKAISFTDAIERSFRVDIAIKKAYRKALEVVYDSVSNETDAKKTCARIFLGTVYIGGDDGLIITPSWLAIPFAHLIAEEFTKQIGLERGLSIGIAVGSARMNIWSLIDCSESLMRCVKDVLRNKMREDPRVSGLCFFAFDSGSPSGEVVKSMLDRLSSKLWNERNKEKPATVGLSIQPYILTPNNSEFWRVFLSLIFMAQKDSPEKLYKQAFETAYKAAHENYTWIRKVRNCVMDCWNAVKDSKHWKELAVVYVKRQMERPEDDEKRRIYKTLYELIKQTYTEYNAIPFADILTVCKIVGGGVP